MTIACILNRTGVIVRISEMDDPSDGESAIPLEDGEWLVPGKWRWTGIASEFEAIDEAEAEG